jgi:hypothetical protein
MRIGILGVGNIGKTLSLKLAANGHDVRVANSRGPHSIDDSVLASGAVAVRSDDLVQQTDVLIVSIPLNKLAAIAPLVSALPEDTVVVDTSNYYPARDEKIDAIEAGQVESVWVSELIGRRVVKAWNAIGSGSFADKGLPKGTSGRIAIPVAGDDQGHIEIACGLVDATGFDAYVSGSLDQSWRQQPGSPCYCTDLTSEEMPTALAAADRNRLPKRRDLAVAAISERFEGEGANPTADFGVRLSRALYM